MLETNRNTEENDKFINYVLANIRIARAIVMDWYNMAAKTGKIIKTYVQFDNNDTMFN